LPSLMGGSLYNVKNLLILGYTVQK